MYSQCVTIGVEIEQGGETGDGWQNKQYTCMWYIFGSKLVLE